MAMSPGCSEALRDWTTVVRKCFIARHDPQAVKDALQTLHNRSPLDGGTLVLLVLRSGAKIPDMVDPLIPAYLLQLLRTNILDSDQILTTLLSCLTLDDQKQQSLAPFVVQESVLSLLSNVYALEERPRRQLEVLRCFRSLSSWFKACNAFEANMQMNVDGLQAHSPGLLSVYEALGTLAVVMFSSTRVKKLLRNLTLPRCRSASFLLWNMSALTRHS